MESLEIVKVLVVDNEKLFTSTLASHLRLSNIEVECACSGEEALDTVLRFRPDIMILDLWMDHIDGLEVLKQVKASNPEIEVIILTGNGSFDTAITCMQLGAFDYLIKPVDLNQLMEVIAVAYTPLPKKYVG